MKNEIKFITHYHEFDSDEKESLLENISGFEISNKSKVLAYLKNGKDDGVLCSAVYDYIEKRSTGKTVHCYTDGEYCWDDKEIYHFEHYNLKLDDEFLQKALRSE